MALQDKLDEIFAQARDAGGHKCGLPELEVCDVYRKSSLVSLQVLSGS
jgi:hypothetical protein